MTTLQRDEQKAVDLLHKAGEAVIALGFPLDVEEAINSMLFGVETYVKSRAISRENNPPVLAKTDEPEGEFRQVFGSDSGEGKDTLGQHDQ